MSLRFYTIERLSDHRERTPEGFLLCKDVPFARIGTQIYGASELPKIEPGPDGTIVVDRPIEEVFRPETIASFEGKPVTNDHPVDGMVTPATFRDYVVGVVIGPRRGDGYKLDNNFLYADLLIQEANAIADIEAGKKEVSAGYDSEYEIIEPGVARQHDIIGNHIALVDRGRCGPQCAIGDQAIAFAESLPEKALSTEPVKTDTTTIKAADCTCNEANDRKGITEMASKKYQAFKDAIRRAVRTRDDATVLNAVAEAAKDPEILGEIASDAQDFEMPAAEGGSHVHVHMHPAGAREDAEEPMAPAGAPAAPAPAAAGASSGLEERLARLEQAVAMLVQGEESEPWHGEEPEEAEEELGEEKEDDDGYMDRRRSRDARRRSRDRVARDRRGRARDEGEEHGEHNEEKKWKYGDPGETEDDNTEIPEGFGYGEKAPSVPEHPEPNQRGGSDSKTKDRARVGDSTSMEAEFMDMISKGEMLVPGAKYPNYDSRNAARDTARDMCAYRRRALNTAYRTNDSRQHVQKVTGEVNPALFLDSSKMTCDAIKMVFNAAANFAGQANNRVHSPTAINTFKAKSPASVTPADINARNREFYARKA